MKSLIHTHATLAVVTRMAHCGSAQRRPPHNSKSTSTFNSSTPADGVDPEKRSEAGWGEALVFLLFPLFLRCNHTKGNECKHKRDYKKKHAWVRYLPSTLQPTCACSSKGISRVGGEGRGREEEERRDGVGRGHKSGGSALDSAAEQG